MLIINNAVQYAQHTKTQGKQNKTLPSWVRRYERPFSYCDFVQIRSFFSHALFIVLILDQFCCLFNSIYSGESFTSWKACGWFSRAYWCSNSTESQWQKEFIFKVCVKISANSLNLFSNPDIICMLCICYELNKM